MPFQQLRHAAVRKSVQPRLNRRTGTPGQSSQPGQGVLAAGGPVHHLEPFFVARIRSRTDLFLEAHRFRHAQGQFGSFSSHVSSLLCAPDYDQLFIPNVIENWYKRLVKVICTGF